MLTSQTDEPRCEEPTSYTSTTAALVVHLLLFVSFPAKFENNIYTLGALTEIRYEDHKSNFFFYQRNISVDYCLQDLHPFCQVLSVDEFQGEVVLQRKFIYGKKKKTVVQWDIPPRVGF